MNDTFDLLARGIPVQRMETLNQFHRLDISAMEESGYPVTDCGAYVECNVFAFTLLARDSTFKVIASGKDDKQNCRAYPRDSDGLGGWDIQLYGRTAEQMEAAGCSGWKPNRNGWARRPYPGHKMVAGFGSRDQCKGGFGARPP